jgi:hypothetical protein
MTRFLPAIAIAAAALAGCDRSDQTIVQGPYDPQADMVANAGNVQLPPSIVASHQYRCKDNSLVSIEWLSDGKANSARVTPKGGATVVLAQAEAPAPAEGEPAAPASPDYVAEGATLKGDPQAASVTWNGQVCKR